MDLFEDCEGIFVTFLLEHVVLEERVISLVSQDVSPFFQMCWLSLSILFHFLRGREHWDSDREK